MFYYITSTEKGKSSQHPEDNTDTVENRRILKTESEVHCATVTSSIGHSNCCVLRVGVTHSSIRQLHVCMNVKVDNDLIFKKMLKIDHECG